MTNSETHPSALALLTFVENRWKRDKIEIVRNFFLDQRLQFVRVLLAFYDTAEMHSALGDRLDRIITYLKKIDENNGRLPVETEELDESADTSPA